MLAALSNRHRQALLALSTVSFAALSLVTCASAQEASKPETERIYAELPFKEVVIVPTRKAAAPRPLRPASDDPLSLFTPLTDPYQYAESGVAPTGTIPIDFQLAAVKVTKRDGSQVTFPPPVQSRAQVAELLFGSSGSSLRSVIETISWGQSSIQDGSLSGATIPDDSFETIEIDLRRAPNRSEAFCFSIPEQFESGRGRYTFVSTEARDFFNCPWAAATDSQDGGIYVAMDTGGVSQGSRDRFLRILAHEHGHLLGLLHSHGDAVKDPELEGAAMEYGDPNCLMGTGIVTAIDRVNAAQSYRLGWIRREDVVVLSEPGTHTVQITTADSGPGTALPSSIWIYREPREFRGAAPALFVISSSVQSKIFTELSRGENGMTASSIPEGLVIHSVPLDNGYVLAPPVVKHRTPDSGSFLEGTVPVGASIEIETAGITVRLLSRQGNTSTVEIKVTDLAGTFAGLGLERVPELGELFSKAQAIRSKPTLTDHDTRVLAALTRVINKAVRTLGDTKPFSTEHFRDGRRVVALLKDIQAHAKRDREGTAPPPLSVRKLKSAIAQYLEIAAR